MSLPVIVLREAERDLESIVDFIAAHDSAENARHILRSLNDVIRRLANLPSRGNVSRELRALGLTQFREAHHKPYRIIYRVREASVVVHCIVDGRRDMQSLLQRRLLHAP
ncbi:type II toxin-antitoxin system RelE/ParE family toxin [Inquilinus sp.]|jgi:toxin ParE1/3/4|uniref:type II toxin-antitoxin system RelE/ParE family toxin n=1 Tax=Inquilinus sp. TaxID=1932117 RepID=UPI0037830F15